MGKKIRKKKRPKRCIPPDHIREKMLAEFDPKRIIKLPPNEISEPIHPWGYKIKNKKTRTKTYNFHDTDWMPGRYTGPPPTVW